MENITYPLTEMPIEPDWVSLAKKYPDRIISVNKLELDDRYMHFAVLPERIFFAGTINGQIELPAKKILSLEHKLELAINKQKSLIKCIERNNRGTQLEKSGNISEAIKVYEENIKPRCYPATHSFDRLLVLYRYIRDYQNELRVCKRAVKIFPSIDKYAARLEKIQLLISKDAETKSAETTK